MLIRLTWRLTALSACLLAGLAAAPFYARLGRRRRQALIQAWARGVLASLGVRLEVRGVTPMRPGLIVANHISWIDVLAIAALSPATFVCKAEVGDWPAIGGLLRRIGTIFIRRARLRDVRRVKDTLAGRLAAGQMVALFPEGTTSDGAQVLPFHSGLFESALEALSPVYPVRIAYSSRAAGFVGDTSFASSLLAIACAPALRADVAFMPPLLATRCRKEAARRSRDLIAASMDAGASAGSRSGRRATGFAATSLRFP